MKAPKHTIEEYRDISGDVWTIFKNYFEDVETDNYTLDIDAVEKKHSQNPRLYEFCCKLMKVYQDELNELKGLHKTYAARIGKDIE